MVFGLNLNASKQVVQIGIKNKYIDMVVWCFRGEVSCFIFNKCVESRAVISKVVQNDGAESHRYKEPIKWPNPVSKYCQNI